MGQALLQRNYSGLLDGAQQTLHSEASRLTDLVNSYFRTTGFQVLDVGLYDLSINMQGEQSFDAAFQTADAEVQGQAIPAARQPILRSKLNLNAYLLMVWQVAADGRSLNLRWKLRLPDNGILPPTELLELEGILTSMGSQVAEQQLSNLGLGKWAEAAGAGVKKIVDLLERKMRGEEVLAGEVYLSRITFKNFHPVEFNNKPEWKYQSDSLSSSSPLCYVGGTNMQMFPEIKCPQNKVISNTIRVKIKYDGIESLPFEAVYNANSGLITASAADGVWFSLEHKISLRNLLNIDWFLKIGETSDWFFTGTSKHQIFVILNKPPTNIQARIEHLYFTCSQADGVSSEKEMVDIIWNAFKERSLHLQMFRPDQEAIPFTYYLTPNKGCSRGIIDSLPTLVNGKKIIDGECGAFADLLSRLLLVQGIKHYMIVVAPKNDKGFLIQNWAFSKQTTIGNYPYLNIFESADADPRSEGNSYKKWKAGSPLAFYDLPGIKGQNVENPYSDFEDHYFIKVGTEYFDPSYGTRHTKIEDWVAASIAGFTDEIRLRANTTNLYDFKARRSNSPIMDLDITESIRE
ncbi:hypothetical protein, partial [Haliscomenobacter sp.]|uniref:hypothetical protein n=1 Tax=Haliscomenobacter sp. TaxID=2717303 RepID=UPI003364FAB6